MNINSIDDLVLKTNISSFIRSGDIVKGKNYDLLKINFVEEKEMQEYHNVVNYYHYEVDSETKKTYYDVAIFIQNHEEIIRTLCDCKQFRATNSCKHIAAVLVNNYTDFFYEAGYVDNLAILSNRILDKFVSSSKNIIKKELNVVLNIDIERVNNYYYYHPHNELKFKILIGKDKMYTLGTHLNAFRSAYESGEGSVKFGKDLTYDPNEFYFDKESETVLNAYLDLTNSYANRHVYETNLKVFFNKIKNCSFIVNNYQINGILDEFPIDTSLIKKDDKYELNFDMDEIKNLIEDDYEYLLYKGKMYHLNKKQQDLLMMIEENNLNSLIINKEKVPVFTKGILGLIKKKLNIDASVDDLVIPNDLTCELYFDLRDNYILADAIFIYDVTKINYFEEDNSLLRDVDFEAKVMNDLLKHGFTIKDKKIILDDLEREVEFLENGLEELAAKYPVYTTEKFKSVNIKKKIHVSSMFGIGSDNILNYNFNLDGINSKEIVNIFKEIKNKKKYYRLKNGDILNLEDESLQELESLTEDLELSDQEIVNGHGSILKYRAIYLDSLKNTKYNIISTDNLFDNFIKQFYEFKDADLTLSKKELRVLRDYQVTGVKWLYNLAKCGFGGILADEMGLGKTIQVIYYIKQMLKENSNSLFLIVVPTSLAYNWEHEFDMFAKEVKKDIVIGNKDKRINIINKSTANVLITTYGLLREDEELYQEKTFNTMIIDEAQNIKNNLAGVTKSVKKINAQTKFALTGTPLENSILELWSIFDFIMPGYLAHLSKFQSKYKIKDFDSDSEILIQGLSKVINPFILRRKKMDVVKELPDKLVNDIYIDLDSEQKKLYVAELERVKEEMNDIMANDGMSKARFLFLQLLTKLRELCIDPSILYENYTGTSNKIERLISIVEEYTQNNHKILIFSSFRTALNIVREKLNSQKIKTYMIDGSVPAKERVEMVDKFNTQDDVKVFLIMLKSGGTGLNLASADVVIHLDLWWNPQAENQATDRAHRIGQINTVTVIHLITRGTIEEKILELQNKKRILSDKLIDGEVRDKNILADLTKEDIENLLSYENQD